ncbi:CTD small phosphatase-like protein 2-A [Protopterus annectens]|uniref:CTD small phosphatase-like protein 2-A n=1 Tax=Protopterus annectens TaxID=7888 RepID=UPI001CFA70C7|nr:CTD small phosphatase-like protein 2-A [Protopterus annectens]
MYVRVRPFVREFLEQMSQIFEIIVYTSALEVYAGQLLDILDPENKFIRHRVFRKHCDYYHGCYLKNLNAIRRKISKTVVMHSSPLDSFANEDEDVEQYLSNRLHSLDLLPPE